MINLRIHWVFALLALTLPAQGQTIITADVDTPAEFSGHWTASQFDSPITIDQTQSITAVNFTVFGAITTWAIQAPTGPGVALYATWLEGGFERAVWELPDTPTPIELRVEALRSGSPVIIPFSLTERGVTADYTWQANSITASPAYEGTFKLTQVVVPEPHEYGILAGLGLLGFVAYRRFRG